jgi:small subunit ribosomal protein S18
MIQKKRRQTTKAPRADKHLTFSYKNVETLERYITEQGAIVARAKSGLSQQQQRQLASEVKRARHLALLPFTQTL